MQLPWQLALSDWGREEYLQRLVTTLIVGGDPPRWNTPSRPTEQGQRFLQPLDEVAHGVESDGLRQVLPGMFAMEGTAKRHLATNHVFDQVDDTTIRVGYILTVLEAETAPAVVATAWVTDTFHHQGGTWLVDEHAIAIDASFQAPA